MTELCLIPRGSLAQNMFRDAYFCLRENSLGRQPEIAADPLAVRDEAVALVRRTFPGFMPEHDPSLVTWPRKVQWMLLLWASASWLRPRAWRCSRTRVPSVPAAGTLIWFGWSYSMSYRLCAVF